MRRLGQAGRAAGAIDGLRPPVKQPAGGQQCGSRAPGRTPALTLCVRRTAVRQLRPCHCKVLQALQAAAAGGGGGSGVRGRLAGSPALLKTVSCRQEARDGGAGCAAAVQGAGGTWARAWAHAGPAGLLGLQCTQCREAAHKGCGRGGAVPVSTAAVRSWRAGESRLQHASWLASVLSIRVQRHPRSPSTTQGCC